MSPRSDGSSFFVRRFPSGWGINAKHGRTDRDAKFVMATSDFAVLRFATSSSWCSTRMASNGESWVTVLQMQPLGENSTFRIQTYPSLPPLSPSCSAQAAVTSGLLTPPPTSCSTSPQSSAHSTKSFE